MTGSLFIGEETPSSLGALDRLYAGEELVWPPAVEIPTYVAVASVPFAGAGVIALDFAGPTAFFGHRITVTADLGQVLENTHPFTWGVSNSMFVRATIESQSLNGGAFALRANNVVYTPGTWVEINPTSNFFTVSGGAPTTVNLTADTLLHIQISDAPNGGNIVYDAFSLFSILRT